MLEALKDKTRARIFTHPRVQEVLSRAAHLRSDLLDQLDDRLAGVARRLNLATRKELKALRRQIRELENQVQNLEGQLSHERQRADRAESALGEAMKNARHERAKLEVEASQAKPEPEGEKAAPRKASRKKKSEAEGEE